MPCRKSLPSFIAADEHLAFVKAVLALKDPAQAPSIIPAAQSDGALSRYDDYVWMHKAGFSVVHLGPAFGPWHREILRQFELDLRAVSGDDSICIPYWDWSTVREPGDPGWPFTSAFLGGFGSAPTFQVADGPFAHSAGAWNINVHDTGDAHVALRRASLPSPTSSSLPSAATILSTLTAQPYDSPPYNDASAPSSSEADASFRKSLEFFLHNGPHNWVGRELSGTPTDTSDDLFFDMMARASPNDPVFFLHHSNVDRIWSIWQDRHPGLDGFLPVSGADAGHNAGDVMAGFSATWFNFPTPATNEQHVDLHASGVWYDSDVPRLSLSIPTVSFGIVPAGLTTYGAVEFSVEGCRAFSLRITAVSGSGFSIPAGSAVVPVLASDDPQARSEKIFVQCVAPADGSTLGPGQVQVEAFLVDSDGTLTGTVGAEHIIETFTATLVATVAPRRTTAVAFVSDRSGSMKGSAGGGLTKFQLVEEAIEVATDLLASDDSAALLFFDHAVSTPLSMSAVGSGSAVSTALADPGIQPATGSTAIGSALIAGAAELDSYTPPADVTDPNLAMICLTDGNENSGPSVTSSTVTSAVAAYTSDLYAIGLGTPDNTSADTLGAISTYMLVTGAPDADTRRFMVTKYFVQILADVKQADIIVDPDGVLFEGQEHEIPFDVTEADVELELITLCPAAELLGFELVTPGGSVLGEGSWGPNASVDYNRLDAIIRVSLPAEPASPGTSHAGRWRLRLSTRRRSKHTRAMVATRLASRAARADQPAAGGLPYSVIVQTRSSLRLTLGRQPVRVLPGQDLQLVLSASQFGQPLASLSVVAHLTDPTGRTTVHTLRAGASGQVNGQLPAPMHGVYTGRFVVRGRSRSGYGFTREATRTWAVGHPLPAAPQAPDPSPASRTCELLRCLLRDRGIRKLLASHEIDLEALLRCLDCDDRPTAEDPCQPGVQPRSAGAEHTPAGPTDLLSVARLVVGELERRTEPLPELRPFVHPVVPKEQLEAPMFMPALVRLDTGAIVSAVTGQPLRPGEGWMHHGHGHGGKHAVPVRKLKGVGPATEHLLVGAGIRTVAQLLARVTDLGEVLGWSEDRVQRLVRAARQVG